MNHPTREEYYQIKKTDYTDMWRSNCPFCAYETKEQKELILWRWKYWYILKNKFPYTNTGRHLMAVPYKHKKFATELNSEEYLEIQQVQKFVKKYFWEEDYFSFTRETFGNRSLEHYHIQFLNGKLEGKFLRKMLKGQGLFD